MFSDFSAKSSCTSCIEPEVVLFSPHTKMDFNQNPQETFQRVKGMVRYECWSYVSKDKEGRKVDDICSGSFVLNTIVTLPEVLFVSNILLIWEFSKRRIFGPPTKTSIHHQQKWLSWLNFFKALKEYWETLPFLTLIDPQYFRNNYSQGGGVIFISPKNHHLNVLCKFCFYMG